MSILRTNNANTLSTTGNLQPGSGLLVNVLPPGGIASASSTANVITMAGGHGFVAGQKSMVGINEDTFSGAQTIQSVTATTITFPTGTAFNVTTGDTIINLGTDSGTAQPNYDGGTVSIYSDPALANAVTNAQVTVDGGGGYQFYHPGSHFFWELVRSADSSVGPVQFVVNAYAIADQNTSVENFATGGTGTSSDPWTGWETAFSAIPTSGTTIEFLPGFYKQNTTIKLPVNLTGWLKVVAEGGVNIQLTSSAPRMFDIAAHSDYDTLGYIELGGFNLDANNITGNNHILIGTTQAGVVTTRSRLNYAKIKIHDIRIYNVPDSGPRTGIQLNTTHTTGGETATTCSDISIWRVRQEGGTNGIVLTAGADDSSANVNHTFNRIHIASCYHASIAVPTAVSNAASIQVGQNGFVIDCLIEDCYSANSSDVGIEVDNPYRCSVRNCVFIDAAGYGILVRNFNTGVVISKNSCEVVGCRAICLNGAVNDINFFAGFGATGTTSALALGMVKFKDCYYETNDAYLHRPVNVTAYVKHFVLDGFQVYAPSLTDAQSVSYYNLFGTTSQYVNNTLSLKNIRIDLTMNTLAHSPIVALFQVESESGRLELEDVVANITYTGNGGATAYFEFCDSTQSNSYSNNIVGRVRGLRLESFSGASGASRCYGVRFRQYLGASSAIIVSDCDFSALPSGSFYTTIDATADIGQVTFRDILTNTFPAPLNCGTWPITSATSGTDTACSNGTAYVGSIFVPFRMKVTGVQYLVGSVGGTDKVVASIHDAAGALIANSATAGATVGTAAQTQQVALTSTVTLPGPASYFLALTFNGTTAKFRTIPAFCNAGNGVIGNSVTQTFGTPAAFTAPTTFTADKVPVASLY